VRWAEGEPGARLERGAWLPWEDFAEHDLSLGQSEDEVCQRFEQTQDVRVEYRGKTAFAGAGHWQFVAYKKVLGEFLPLEPEAPLRGERRLEERMNAAGYLRLTTTKPLVMHMGNVPPRQLVAERRRAARSARDGYSRLLNWSPLRRALLFVHNTIFRWYFGV
jgi:hypothetical protein